MRRHDAKRIIRCAIYTRKSPRRRLEQIRFNTLQAQRDACEAYIRSPAGEGFFGLRCQTRMMMAAGPVGRDRPALNQLLAEIDKGRSILLWSINYRPPRALGRFSKIVERLEAKMPSLSSGDAVFNTATSMGRLTSVAALFAPVSA